MTSGFRFSYLAEADYPRLAAFISEHWGLDHPYVREPALFDWAFRRRALWDRDGYSWLYAEDQGSMVASIGAIPFELNVRGETALALWPVTWMTASAYRKTGVGLWLLGTLRRPPYRALVCFGARDDAAEIYRALRFQMIADIPRRVAFLPHRRKEATELIAAAHPDWPPARVEALVSRYATAMTPPISPDVPGDDFWSRWDRHGWEPWAPHVIGAKRDAGYLRWRYLGHPVCSYHFIHVEEAGRIGLLVWRLDPVHLSREERLGSFARIVELIPASAANAADLLRRLWTDLARRPDVIGADLYNYHGETGRWLAAAGMAQASDHPDGQGIPSGFQPIDRRCKAIPSAVWIRREASPRYPFAEDDPWYWTKSDSDRDTPMW